MKFSKGIITSISSWINDIVFVEFENNIQSLIFKKCITIMKKFLLKIFDFKKSEFEHSEVHIGKSYTGLGNCGMTKDIWVTGFLYEHNKSHDHAILIEHKTGRHCSVIYKTLERIENKF